jgi:hypothetical protein
MDNGHEKKMVGKIEVIAHFVTKFKNPQGIFSIGIASPQEFGGRSSQAWCGCHDILLAMGK